MNLQKLCRRCIRGYFSLAFLVLLSMGELHSSPISLELKEGKVLQGELLFWDTQAVSIHTNAGLISVPLTDVAEESVKMHDLNGEFTSVLKNRIEDLEGTIRSLRRDNAALREQLETAFLKSSSGSTAVPAAIKNEGAKAVSASGNTASFTISSTGKRHNINCRFYGSGRNAGPTEGVACKICGG